MINIPQPGLTKIFSSRFKQSWYLKYSPIRIKQLIWKPVGTGFKSPIVIFQHPVYFKFIKLNFFPWKEAFYISKETLFDWDKFKKYPAINSKRKINYGTKLKILFLLSFICYWHLKVTKKQFQFNKYESNFNCSV